MMTIMIFILIIIIIIIIMIIIIMIITINLPTALGKASTMQTRVRPTCEPVPENRFGLCIGIASHRAPLEADHLIVRGLHLLLQLPCRLR